jgi:hypothetical protein
LKTLYSRNEGWNQFLPTQLAPVDAAEPVMSLQFVYPVEAKAGFLVSLDKSVHEVHRLPTPPQRHLRLDYFGLVGQDLIPDFLAGISNVGALNQQIGTYPSMISKRMTPSAKKSASKEWFILQMTSGAM